MDLATVKNSLGQNYDIYVINESGVIISTTYHTGTWDGLQAGPVFL